MGLPLVTIRRSLAQTPSISMESQSSRTTSAEGAGQPELEALRTFDTTWDAIKCNTGQVREEKTPSNMGDLHSCANPCNALIITRKMSRSAVRIRSSALSFLFHLVKSW